MGVINYPILRKDEQKKKVIIYGDGIPILAALFTQGMRVSH